jgi:retron-type reverse transcriptase
LYYLKLDFSKYFFSINHKILKDKLSEVIKNEELLYIISIIIDSYKSSQIYDDLLGDWDFYLNEENK